MRFKFIFLATDAFFMLMLIGLIIYIIFSLKNQMMRQSLNKLRSNKTAVLSFFILTIYFFIAMLDSIHFRPIEGKLKNGESSYGAITSVLDVMLKPMKNNREKTYSSPFSLHSFSKENIEQANGTKIRDYPPLLHAGKHLRAVKNRNGDLSMRVLYSILIGFFLVYLGYFFYVFFRHHKVQYNPPKEIRLYLSFFILIAIGLIFVLLTSSKYHIMGTEKTGKDVFYIVLKGARTGILIGTLTTIIVTPIAILFGVSAGYLGGWIDDTVQYIYTTLASIPSILLIAAAMLLFQLGLTQEDSIISADKRLLYLCLIMGISSWTGLCRLIRAETLKLKEIEYVQAAHAFGLSNIRIMLKHIIPNLMHIVVITVILRFSGLVLAEAVLAYVGIGVDPTMNSWGNMINQARLELSRDPIVWWNLTAAFVFMLGLVLPANLFGDAVRDALDPKLKREK